MEIGHNTMLVLVVFALALSSILETYFKNKK